MGRAALATAVVMVMATANLRWVRAAEAAAAVAVTAVEVGEAEEATAAAAGGLCSMLPETTLAMCSTPCRSWTRREDNTVHKMPSKLRLAALAAVGVLAGSVARWRGRRDRVRLVCMAGWLRSRYASFASP